jgi:TPR repeat protein
MYEHGVGVAQDKNQAVRWFRDAADSGVPQAQNSLGLAYLRGWIPEEDHTQALTWFLKAAQQGHVGAEVNAALLYAHGHCMPRDLVTAYAWTEIARKAKAQQAERLLAQWGQEMTGEQIAAALRQARELQPRVEQARASLH